MASRPIFSPYQVITNGDMTQTLHSKVTIVQNLSMISYEISWSGTPTGAFTVEVSNTYSQNAAGAVVNTGNWTALALSSAITATGSAGVAFADVDATGAYAVRLTYVPSGGSGTLQATVAGKVA